MEYEKRRYTYLVFKQFFIHRKLVLYFPNDWLPINKDSLILSVIYIQYNLLAVFKLVIFVKKKIYIFFYQYLQYYSTDMRKIAWSILPQYRSFLMVSL